jgi:hypothetical protein
MWEGVRLVAVLIARVRIIAKGTKTGNVDIGWSPEEDRGESRKDDECQGYYAATR